ncbi:MAG TPA: glutamine--tRNA ligase/YqeY domain fusion protein [Clostridiales bacterium]|nr:glutamine--tRNA ligase/YqeY domain fusion protein [Clostridiales bacterium]
MNFIEEIIVDDLNNGKIKQLITRFPPEPNGYLHIGHAKAICLNFSLAQKYNGICNLRFDDTNPEKEEEEYCNAIIKDVEWLGFKGDIYYASDYFDIMYDCAIKLIKKGKAYVCELTPDEIREYRGTLTEPGKPSPYRERSIEENLKLFEQMREGKFPDGSMTLRAKIDMASPNINMRDPVLYRILRAHHHRQGDKWCIYPMYDFAHPIEDAVEKITHSICTLEFEDHRPLYDWVVNECEFDPKPRQFEFARLNLTRTIMSKRYLKKLVDEGVVDGWDDPRMPTLAGMRRRGYPPEAIRELCELIGVSKANSVVDVALLEHCVRDVLNVKADRVMVVKEPLKVTITNYPEGKSEILKIENHPNDPERGEREVAFSGEIFIEKEDFKLVPPPKYKRLVKGGIVRLKGAYIIRCDDVILDENGEPKELKCTYFTESKSGQDTSGLKPKGVIHFVDARQNYPCKLIDYDYLLDDDDTKQDFLDRLNKNSKIEYIDAVAEKSLQDARAGVPYQFMRQAYYCRDSKTNAFIQIVGLKDSYKIK